MRRRRRPKTGDRPIVLAPQVLQQKTSAAIFGTADAGATVTLTLSGDATESKTSQVGALGGDDNVWRVDLSPRQAGGNYTLTLSCDGCANSTTTTLEDVTFGDVYFRRADIPLMNRGDAVAATWIFRGDERRRTPQVPLRGPIQRVARHDVCARSQ